MRIKIYHKYNKIGMQNLLMNKIILFDFKYIYLYFKGLAWESSASLNGSKIIP